MMFNEKDLLIEMGHQVADFSRRFDDNVQSEFEKYFAPNIYYENVSVFRKAISAFELTYSFRTRKLFKMLIDNYKPDIIHAHSIYGRLTTSILDCAREKRIPVVMTLHDYKLICPSYRLLSHGCICEDCRGGKFYYAILNRCHKNSLIPSLIYSLETYFNNILNKYINGVDFFLCPSLFTLDKHASMGIPRDKLIHVPNHLDTNKYIPHYIPGKHILYFGRISHEKGILTMLNALKGSGYPLKIVGDGPVRPTYEQYAKDHCIDSVTFEGHKSGKDLESIIRQSAFVICPSEWYENFPMVVLESMALGKPVIGANIGGIPEMIDDGVNGFLFTSGDHESLRMKIHSLYTDSAQITKMGKNARNKVETNWNKHIHSKELMQAYHMAIESRKC